MCYDYMYSDTLSDISACRTVVKPQRNINRIKYGVKSFILSALGKSLYISMTAWYTKY